MENKNKSHKHTKFSIVIGCILAVLLFAAPCSALVVTGDEPVNIGYGYEIQEVDFLIVLGTANLHTGAYIYQGGMALGGSTINIYGGQISASGYITAFNSATNPAITVYGSNFAVDGQPCEHSATSFTLVPGVYKLLTGFYGNGDPINLWFYGNIPIYLVTLESEMVIDIKPGNDENNINLKSKGVVPVAVLTTDDFDAATIDPATAQFAGAAPERWKLEDVDDDGDDDLMFHFRTQELDLGQDSTEATLTAQLTGPITIQSTAQVSGGTTVSGTDEVRIVSAKKSKK
ncbi:MAG: hypothetical protein WBC05_08435 [Sedimentisphaerales bacterium]